MDTPWEHELERALVSQLASVRLSSTATRPTTARGEDVESDVESDVEDVESVESDADARDDDRAAQLDELTALASIFGDDLGAPQPRTRSARRARARVCAHTTTATTTPGAPSRRLPRRVSCGSTWTSSPGRTTRRRARTRTGEATTRIVLVSDTTPTRAMRVARVTRRKRSMSRPCPRCASASSSRARTLRRASRVRAERGVSAARRARAGARARGASGTSGARGRPPSCFLGGVPEGARAARGRSRAPRRRAAMLCSTTKTTRADGRSLPRCASTRARRVVGTSYEYGS